MSTQPTPAFDPYQPPVGPGRGELAMPGPAREPVPGQGYLIVSLENPSRRAELRPGFTVDGFNAEVEWGLNRIPVAPGAHQVQASIAGTRLDSPVLTVAVPPGGEAPVYYVAPTTAFSRGVISQVPQSVPSSGRALLLGFLIAFLVIPLILAVVGFVAFVILGAG